MYPVAGTRSTYPSLPLHECHEFADEEGEVEDADLLGESDGDLLLGREGFQIVPRDNHHHALSECPPHTLVWILLQIPVDPELQDESADAELEVAGRAQELTFLINRTSHITSTIPDNTSNIFLNTDLPGRNNDVIIALTKAPIIDRISQLHSLAGIRFAS